MQNDNSEMDQAMEKLRDGIRKGKEALKNQRLPISEQVREEKPKRGRPRGARNKGKLGDRRTSR